MCFFVFFFCYWDADLSRIHVDESGNKNPGAESLSGSGLRKSEIEQYAKSMDLH